MWLDKTVFIHGFVSLQQSDQKDGWSRLNLSWKWLKTVLISKEERCSYRWIMGNNQRWFSQSDSGHSLFTVLIRLWEHCTVCCLLNRNSSGLLAPGDILKNPQKYVGKIHFFLSQQPGGKLRKIHFCEFQTLIWPKYPNLLLNNFETGPKNAYFLGTLEN